MKLKRRLKKVVLTILLIIASMPWIDFFMLKTLGFAIFSLPETLCTGISGYTEFHGLYYDIERTIPNACLISDEREIKNIKPIIKMRFVFNKKA